ncbi:MAG: YceH family protein [Gemmataceae bacterium]|nr:YceH family protein [Gemmataceae bacterium]
MADDAIQSSWPVLNVLERRVLGVLVEKAKTTPDVYPLSLNSVVTGSNQKSNRDPVLSINDEHAEETLVGLQKQGLVTRITGGRVERWRHNLYEVWSVGKVELAILTELLLRGPQTEGELRGRASRMEPIDDLDALRQVLRPMAERRLVVFLGEEGRRGTQITHGFHAPEELERVRSQPRSEEAGTVIAAPASDRFTALEASVAELRQEVAALRQDVEQLKQR